MSNSTPRTSRGEPTTASDMDNYDRVMIVIAHPDDAEFGSAGTLAKFAREGKEVVIVLCTNGDKGTSRRDLTSPQLATIREAEQTEASRVLGVKETVFLRQPDGELEPNMKFREMIVRQIRKHRPDILITHDPFRPYAFHSDHRAVGITAVDSVYPTARDPLFFPQHLEAGLEPHKVAELWMFGSETPDTFIDISETLEIKVEALLAHASQVGDGPETRERLTKSMTERAQNLAENVEGIEFAEAFKVVKMRR